MKKQISEKMNYTCEKFSQL